MNEVESWLSFFSMATAQELNMWFSTSNYAALQERLNQLVSAKETLVPEFVDFLGIDD